MEQTTKTTESCANLLYAFHVLANFMLTTVLKLVNIPILQSENGGMVRLRVLPKVTKCWSQIINSDDLFLCNISWQCYCALRDRFTDNFLISMLFQLVHRDGTIATFRTLIYSVINFAWFINSRKNNSFNVFLCSGEGTPPLAPL